MVRITDHGVFLKTTSARKFRASPPSWMSTAHENVRRFYEYKKLADG